MIDRFLCLKHKHKAYIHEFIQARSWCLDGSSSRNNSSRKWLRAGRQSRHPQSRCYCKGLRVINFNIACKCKKNLRRCDKQAVHEMIRGKRSADGQMMHGRHAVLQLATRKDTWVEGKQRDLLAHQTADLVLVRAKLRSGNKQNDPDTHSNRQANAKHEHAKHWAMISRWSANSSSWSSETSSWSLSRGDMKMVGTTT